MNASPDRPSVSIVVPTHNRDWSLRRALFAIAAQDYPAELTEVVVVADGCRDDTVAVAREFSVRMRLELVEQENQGPAGARNSGAERASGELLLFLDDDVEAVPGLVTAHIAAHSRLPPWMPSVVSGYYPPRLSHQSGLYGVALVHWWETIFDQMAAPGHRFAYQDLLSGNFSLAKSLFVSVGGFRRDLWVKEDGELGLRLIRHGAAFRFAPEAMSYHHETSDLRRSARRKREEGRSDIQLGRLYPDLYTRLPATDGRFAKAPLRIAFGPKFACDLIIALLYACIAVADHFKARSFWKRLTFTLFDIHYGLGLRDQIGSRRALAAFPTSPPPPVAREEPTELDLSQGVEAAEDLLDRQRPSEIVILYRGSRIARLGGEPDRERFHGAHLRPLLATVCAWPLIQAIGTSRLDDRDVFAGASGARVV